MRLMEGNHVGPFNLGNPGEFTMLELAQVNELNSFTVQTANKQTILKMVHISVQILALFLYFLLLFHNTKGTNE